MKSVYSVMLGFDFKDKILGLGLGPWSWPRSLRLGLVHGTASLGLGLAHRYLGLVSPVLANASLGALTLDGCVVNTWYSEREL